MAHMTKEVLVQACKANKGYAPPHLNDQIYLHCKGFMKIENLEEYTELKALWLEQNSIADLSGLAFQQKLVSLFIHNNALITLQHYDAPLHNLRMLNISHNYLTNLKGISTFCPLLETLQCSHNHISSMEACEDLWGLSKTLTSIDLSFNKIERFQAMTPEEQEASDAADAASQAQKVVASDVVVRWPGETPAGKDPIQLVNFFKDHLPNVSVIYLHGNALTHGMKQYRRQMILHLPKLTYLDERPVFADERRVVMAWGAGGEKAEAAERALIREEKKQHLSSCVKILTDKMESNREVRDRLTRQWEQKRDMELEALTQRRREIRDAKISLDAKESAARAVMEREEEAHFMDLQDAFEDEHREMVQDEKMRRREYLQRLEVERVTAEAQREIEEEEEAELKRSTTPPRLKEGSAYYDLVRTDEDIFNEMEEEIQNVLNQVSAGVEKKKVYAGNPHGGSEAETAPAAASAVDPNADWLAARQGGHFDRHTAKAERNVHQAIRATAERLKEEAARRQQVREDRWRQFEQWENRFQNASGAKK